MTRLVSAVSELFAAANIPALAAGKPDSGIQFPVNCIKLKARLQQAGM